MVVAVMFFAGLVLGLMLGVLAVARFDHVAEPSVRTRRWSDELVTGREHPEEGVWPVSDAQVRLFEPDDA